MYQERQITVPGNSQKNKRLLGTSFRILKNMEKYTLDIDFNVKMNKKVEILLLTHYNGYFLFYSKILSLSFIERLLE